MTYQTSHRIAAIACIKSGKTKAETAKIFQVSRDTIYRWLSLEDLTPKPPPKTRNRKINKAELVKNVKENPHMFLRERAAIFGVDPSAISRSLAKLGIVKKTKNATSNEILWKEKST